MTSRKLHAVVKPPHPRFLSWVWQERWLVTAWFGGIPASVYWIYSGMPMICR